MSIKNNNFTESYLPENVFKIVDKYSNESYQLNQTQIYEDDPIYLFVEKINLFLCEKKQTNSNCLFIWYEIKGKIYPINFAYDDDIDFVDPMNVNYKIDNKFIDKFESVRLQNLINLNDMLLCSILESKNLKSYPTFYFMHIHDFLEKYEINQTTKYNDNNWPEDLPNINMFYHGIVKKYWPKVTLKMLTNHKKDKFEKSWNNIILNSNSLINDFNDEYQQNHLECVKNNITFLKIDTDKLFDNISVNIVKLFSDYKLNENIPFSKLILDGYFDSYYKLYTPSVDSKQIEKYIIDHWIHDFKTDKEFGYNKYINYKNVIIFKIYDENKNHGSLIINKDSSIEFIVDYILLKNKKTNSYSYTNQELTKKIIKNLISIANNFLSKNLDYFIGLNESMVIDDNCLNDNKGLSKTTKINCELFFDKVKWSINHINNLFDNLSVYTRKIQEKYQYKLKNEESIYLRYIRVNNYNNEDTIESVISTLSNPRLNKTKKEIIDEIQNTFNLTIQQAEEKYESWWTIAQNKNKYYSVFSTKEPGIETNIIQRVGSNYTMIELNGLNSFQELNRILIFLKTGLHIYKNFINDKINWKNLNLFNKKKKNKDESKLQKLKDSPENISYELLDDIEPDEQYINPIVVDDSQLSEDQQINDQVESEEYIDPFLTDDESDMEGGGNNISRYFISRLKDPERDKNLFNFNAIKKDPKGNPLVYSRICGPQRQPVVVSNKELEFIDQLDKKNNKKSYFKPPGKDSLKFGSTQELKNKFNYICPRYWDVEKNISLAPDLMYDPFKEFSKKSDKELYIELKNNKNIDISDKKLFLQQYDKNNKFDKQLKETLIELILENTKIDIPEGMWNARNIIPDKAKGIVEQSVLDRKKTRYWRNASDTNVSDYVVKTLGPGYRKENIDMPCCFTKTALVNNKQQIQQDFVFEYEIPSNDNKIGKLNLKFNDLINQDMNIYCREIDILNTMRKINELKKDESKNKKKIDDLIKKEYFTKIKSTNTIQYGLKDIKLYGFLKMGVGKQTDESFLFCLSKIFNMNIQDFKKMYLDKLTIDIYQQSNLFNEFKKDFDIEIFNEFKKDETFQQIKKLNIKSLDLFYRDIKIIENEKQFKQYLLNDKNGKTFSYIFNLYSSWINYKNYVMSNEYKKDEYFSNIIENIFNLNLIVFEDIYNDVKIKCLSKNSIDHTNKQEKEFKYIFMIKKDIYYEPILFKMELGNETTDIQKRYEKSKTKNLFIVSNENNETYHPEAYNFLKDLLFDIKFCNKVKKLNIDMNEDELKECKDNFKDVSFYKKIENSFNGLSKTIDKLKEKQIEIKQLYIDGLNKVSHLITKDDYIIPLNPVDLQISVNIDKIYDLYDINRYKTIDEYKKFLKKIKSVINSNIIDGVCVENSNTIVNLLVNGSYIPVKPELYSNHNYPIKCNIDIRKIDLDIQLNYLENDDFNLFADKYDYEYQINNVYNENIIGFLNKNKSIQYSVNVDEIKKYTNYINKIITLKYDKSTNTGNITNDLYDINIIGKLIDIKQKDKILTILFEPLKMINKIINDNLRINQDKKILLYSIISIISNDVVLSQSVDINKFIENKNCENVEVCEYPCMKQNGKCKLTISDDIFDKRKLTKKFIWKFVDMLLINKGNLSDISYYKLEPYQLEKTKKQDEFFFTYKNYTDEEILDYLFYQKSKYINENYL